MRGSALTKARMSLRSSGLRLLRYLGTQQGGEQKFTDKKRCEIRHI